MLLKQNKTCVSWRDILAPWVQNRQLMRKERWASYVNHTACEHEEETETAEEDKQTSHIRVMDNKQAELPVITLQHWLFQFQGHFLNSITILETSIKRICKHDPRKSTQVRTLYLEMTLQTLPCSSGLWSFSQMSWCVGPRGWGG